MKNLAIVRVVLQKDFRSFWPQASLTALLMTVSVAVMDMPRFTFVIAILQAASLLGSAFLILSVVQDDAIVSSQHDWLIRPLPRGAVLAAKLIFVLVTVMAPTIVGDFVNALLHGYPIAEALSGSGIHIDMLYFALLAVALGSVTANARQAAVVFLSSAVAGIAVLGTVGIFTNLLNDLGTSGIEWIFARGIGVITLALVVAVLWSQYRGRNTARSYKIFFACSGLIVVGLCVPWNGYAALQRWFTPLTAAENVQVDIAPGCFASTNWASLGTEAAMNFPSSIRIDTDRTIDPKAILFATTLQQPALEKNSKLVVSRVTATFLEGDRNLGAIRPIIAYPDRRRDLESQRLFRNYWLLAPEMYEYLADFSRLQVAFDYTLGLLEPKKSIEIAVDGQRAFYKDLGYCGATHQSSREIAVNCYIPNEQPALLTAQVVGDANSFEVRSRLPDYVPAAFDFIGGRRHRIALSTTGTQGARVKITAYEVRAFFDRRFTVPGVLGGPKAACPAPPLQ